jgi:lysyl-tRNA synthetase, class II
MGRYLRGTAALVARALVLGLAIALVTSMATGWLYWLRSGVAHWPGPQVADALPLDELPGHDGVPLLVYVVVFAAAAAALGLIARAVRLDRLTAGISLAAGTGLWLLLVDGFCVFVVRQVPAGQALRVATRMQPVYVAAALAGAAGALLGRRERPGGRTPRLLGWLVAAGGLINLVSALIPRPGPTLGLVEGLGPGVVTPAAHVLLVPVGVLLLITSRGLIRRGQRAWRLAAGLLGASVLLHLLRGPDYAAAIVTGLMAVTLLARRDDFPFRGDPAARPSAFLRLTGMLLLAMTYGVIALWVYRAAFDLPVNLPLAALDTVRAMGGQPPHDAQYLPAEFTSWFPPSVLSIAAIGILWAAAVWLRPWRHRLFPDTQRQQQAVAIVRRWGGDTLAPFTLRLDKDWFVTGQTLVAYRVIRGIALMSGDPVGPPQETRTALEGFLAHAQMRGWRTAVLGASGRLLQTYRDLGLHPLYHGDEAIIDTSHFCLDGRRMRTARQAVHRVQRHGYRTEVVMAGGVTPALRAEVAAVEDAWLRGGTRKGFTMELDSLFRLGGQDAAFVIGRDEQGQAAGFLHLALCPASRSLSLSTMPRVPGTPNGFTAWLITESVSWARSHGFTSLSLNFSPFAGLLAAAKAELPARQRLQRRALLRLKGVLALQLDNLLRFNGQFDPAWVPRYVILQAWADLPRVAVAAMAAEGYLPHARLIRGDRHTTAISPRSGAAPGDGQPPPARPAASEPAGQPRDCAGREASALACQQPGGGGVP